MQKVGCMSSCHPTVLIFFRMANLCFKCQVRILSAQIINRVPADYKVQHVSSYLSNEEILIVIVFHSNGKPLKISLSGKSCKSWKAVLTFLYKPCSLLLLINNKTASSTVYVEGWLNHVALLRMLLDVFAFADVTLMAVGRASGL